MHYPQQTLFEPQRLRVIRLSSPSPQPPQHRTKHHRHHQPQRPWPRRVADALRPLAPPVGEAHPRHHPVAAPGAPPGPVVSQDSHACDNRLSGLKIGKGFTQRRRGRKPQRPQKVEPAMPRIILPSRMRQFDQDKAASPQAPHPLRSLRLCAKPLPAHPPAHLPRQGNYPSPHSTAPDL